MFLSTQKIFLLITCVETILRQRIIAQQSEQGRQKTVIVLITIVTCPLYLQVRMSTT